MSFFSTILNKLGFGQQAPDRVKPAAEEEPKPGVAEGQAVIATGRAVPEPPQPAISVVDVVAQLDGLAAKSAEKLNWKVSIVDLLKLLGLQSDFDTRKALALELGCPEQEMKESAAMNRWLHKTVLQKLAANGGNVPKELL